VNHDSTTDQSSTDEVLKVEIDSDSGLQITNVAQKINVSAKPGHDLTRGKHISFLAITDSDFAPNYTVTPAV
jgi:hypothetical protein